MFNAITESGLYKLIMRSSKPAANRFYDAVSDPQDRRLHHYERHPETEGRADRCSSGQRSLSKLQGLPRCEGASAWVVVGSIREHDFLWQDDLEKFVYE